MTLAAEDIQVVRRRVLEEDWRVASEPGKVDRVDVVEHYMAKALDGLKIERRLKVVADAGNGIAGPVMMRLLGQLDVEAVGLYCEPDGHFPNHHRSDRSRRTSAISLPK